MSSRLNGTLVKPYSKISFIQPYYIKRFIQILKYHDYINCFIISCFIIVRGRLNTSWVSA